MLSGTLIGLYLIIGFCLGIYRNKLIKRKPKILKGLSEFEIQLFNNTLLFMTTMMLVGLPVEIYSWLHTRLINFVIEEIVLEIKGVEVIVLTMTNKEEQFMVEHIYLTHESLEFLDDLDDEEYTEWIEAIRQGLNTNYPFNREVLYFHLSDMQ